MNHTYSLLLAGELTMRSANTDPNARFDIAANGVWGGEKTYFNVRVFNPFSKSNTETPLSETYHRHENEKKRTYEQCVIDIGTCSILHTSDLFIYRWYVQHHFIFL